MGLVKCSECGHDVSTAASHCPSCGAVRDEPAARPKQSVGWWWARILLVAYLAYTLFTIVTHFHRVGEVMSTSDTAHQSGHDPKRDALAELTLDFTWGKSAFGNVMEANFTITNKGAADLKDFEITCTHFAKSGTEIDSNKRTIYDVVKAGQTRRFPNFNMGFIHDQANTSTCRITDVVLQ